jgi:hypothetical protein
MSDYISYSDVDYEWIKEESERMRRELGMGYGVTDLLAMSHAHDPFYRGQPRDTQMAAWFGTIWKKLGLTSATLRGQKVHLRRLHYLLVSRSGEMPPITWGGKRGRYRNIQEHWEALVTAALNARYLGVVPFGAIEDQRNAAPRRFAPYTSEIPDPTVSATRGRSSFAWLPRELVNELPSFDLDGYKSRQRYHLEVWVEKSTMEDVLLPICKALKANLMHASGELSVTQVYEAANRIIASGRPARIFYISDYDPAGQRMPVSAGRKLEWFMRSKDSPLSPDFYEYLDEDEYDVTLTPIALTEEQVSEYDLPRQPLKDQPGKGQWEAVRGKGAVELDALEALHPGTLARIVRDSLGEYYDIGLDNNVTLAEDEAKSYLTSEAEEIQEKYQDRLDKLQADYAALYREVTPRLAAMTEELDRVMGEMADEMESFAEDIDIAKDYPVPEAEEVDDDPDEALVWSERTYDEQLEAYHTFQRRDDYRDAA